MIYNISMKIEHMLENEQATAVFDRFLPGMHRHSCTLQDKVQDRFLSSYFTPFCDRIFLPCRSAWGSAEFVNLLRDLDADLAGRGIFLPQGPLCVHH